jgi:hypothetical protein
MHGRNNAPTPKPSSTQLDVLIKRHPEKVKKSTEKKAPKN